MTEHDDQQPDWLPDEGYGWNFEGWGTSGIDVSDLDDPDTERKP